MDRPAYERLRAAHLHAIRASLEDHVARLEWSRERIERYRTERLRGLLSFARERSPFHPARLSSIDPATATVEDLARVPPMLKQDAQREWDTIVTVPGLRHEDAEREMAERPADLRTPAPHCSTSRSRTGCRRL